MRTLIKALQSRIMLVFIFCIVSACATSQSSVEVSPSESESEVLLDRVWIETNIIGNTISGKAKFSKWGTIPFQMYFNSGQNIYQDRIVVRQTVSTAFGTFSLQEEDLLCRVSRTRNDGAETCWRFSERGSNILMRNVESGQVAQIKTIPGKAF